MGVEVVGDVTTTLGAKVQLGEDDNDWVTALLSLVLVMTITDSSALTITSLHTLSLPNTRVEES